MSTKVLKALLKEKFDLKVKSVDFGNGYCVKAYNYDSQGGSYNLITKYDRFGDVLANKIFNSVSDILIAIKSSKDYKGELENKEKTINSSTTLNVSYAFKKCVYSMLCGAELMHSITHEIVHTVLEQREIEYLKHLVECDMQKGELK